MTFAWVEGREAEWPVALSRRAPGVSRPGYYAWRCRKLSAAEVRRGELAARAARAEGSRAEARGRCGSPRVRAGLVGRGHQCRVGSVAEVTREAGVAAGRGRESRRTTDSGLGPGAALELQLEAGVRLGGGVPVRAGLRPGRSQNPDRGRRGQAQRQAQRGDGGGRLGVTRPPAGGPRERGPTGSRGPAPAAEVGAGSPAALFEFDAVPGFADGVFVG